MTATQMHTNNMRQLYNDEAADLNRNDLTNDHGGDDETMKMMTMLMTMTMTMTKP